MFVKGEGVEKDMDRAFGWFAAAAAQGLAEGCHGLGECYESGEGVPVPSTPSGSGGGGTESGSGGGGSGLQEENLALAAFWFEKAAVQGHRGAVEALEQLENKQMQQQRR
jgi:TPR repeat protein